MRFNWRNTESQSCKVGLRQWGETWKGFRFKGNLQTGRGKSRRKQLQAEEGKVGEHCRCQEGFQRTGEKADGWALHQHILFILSQHLRVPSSAELERESCSSPEAWGMGTVQGAGLLGGSTTRGLLTALERAWGVAGRSNEEAIWLTLIIVNDNNFKNALYCLKQKGKKSPKFRTHPFKASFCQNLFWEEEPSCHLKKIFLYVLFWAIFLRTSQSAMQPVLFSHI